MSQLKQLTSWLNPKVLLDNSYMFAILTIFLTMYGPRLHMKLPTQIQDLFENKVFNMIVLFLIAYMTSKDIKTSIIMTVVFLVFMNIVNSNKIMKMISSESFYNYGPPVSSCNNYPVKSINKTKTPYYPLHNKDNDQSVAIFN